MADKTLFLYVASYASEDDARADYGAIKQLHRDGVIGTYDAAIITKDAKGKVHIALHEKPTQRGAWTGAVAGAVLGLFFPPFLVWDAVIGAAAGAAAGALIGHFWKGMSRNDMAEVGELLDASTAALVVVADSKLEQALAKVVRKATKQYEKEVSTDAKEFNKDLDALVDEMIKGGNA